MQVQEEMQRRAHLRTENGKRKRVYSSKYALSSIVCCGKCGDLYRRVAWKARGKASNKWRCATRIQNGPGACDAETINEDELQKAVIRAINKTLGGREDALIQLQKNIEEVLLDDGSEELAEIDRCMAGLQEKLVMSVNDNEKYDSITKQMDILRERKALILSKGAEYDAMQKRIAEMKEFLETQTGRVTEYDEQMVRRLISKITVFEDKLIFEFKSGMTIDLRR